MVGCRNAGVIGDKSPLNSSSRTDESVESESKRKQSKFERERLLTSVDPTLCQNVLRVNRCRAKYGRTFGPIRRVDFKRGEALFFRLAQQLPRHLDIATFQVVSL